MSYGHVLELTGAVAAGILVLLSSVLRGAGWAGCLALPPGYEVY
jgi:hypothetical protein